MQSRKDLEPLMSILNKYSKSKLDLIQIITPDCSDSEKEVSEDLKTIASTFKTSENATVFQGVLEHLHTTEPDLLCVIRRKRGFFTKLWQEDAVKKRDFESRIPLLVLKGVS